MFWKRNFNYFLHRYLSNLYPLLTDSLSRWSPRFIRISALSEFQSRLANNSITAERFFITESLFIYTDFKAGVLLEDGLLITFSFDRKAESVS